VRFVPNAHYNSQIGPSPTFTFKAWDQTSGTAGSTGDTTTGDAYSAAAAQATLPLTAVNDAPSFNLTSTLVQRTEDDGSVTVSGFAANMALGPAAATDEAAQSLAFLVNVTGTTGGLAFAAAPAIDSTTGALTFTLAPNANGSATIDVVLQDNGSGLAPNVNTSAAQTFTIEVAPVNDEQVLVTNQVVPLEFGANSTITSALLNTSDIDDAPADLVYMVTSGPSHGTVRLNGTPSNSFTQQDIDNGLVAYAHNGSPNFFDHFDFTVNDGEGAATASTVSIFALIGDYNRNRTVDAGDYVVWRKTQGATGLTPYIGADGDGDGDVDTDDLAVWKAHYGNTMPPQLVNIVGDDIDEGQLATVSAKFGDSPLMVEDFRLSVSWQDGTSDLITGLGASDTSGTVGFTQYVWTAATREIVLSHLYVDDNPSGTPVDTYGVALIVEDNALHASGPFTAPVTVHNLPPELTAAGDQSVTSGQLLDLSAISGPQLGTFIDAGLLDAPAATIDWGDGSPIESATVPDFGLLGGTHTYMSPGVFTVTVTLTDDDGGSASDTFTVTVDSPGDGAGASAASATDADGPLQAKAAVPPNEDGHLNSNAAAASAAGKREPQQRPEKARAKLPAATAIHQQRGDLRLTFARHETRTQNYSDELKRRCDDAVDNGSNLDAAPLAAVDLAFERLY
jgi:hypothetical protein